MISAIFCDWISNNIEYTYDSSASIVMSISVTSTLTTENNEIQVSDSNILKHEDTTRLLMKTNFNSIRSYIKILIDKFSSNMYSNSNTQNDKLLKEQITLLGFIPLNYTRLCDEQVLLIVFLIFYSYFYVILSSSYVCVEFMEV